MSAESSGAWLEMANDRDGLRSEIDQLKAINAELLAALQKLLTFPNKKHFNGESYAEEHSEVIGECLAAIAIATGDQK